MSYEKTEIDASSPSSHDKNRGNDEVRMLLAVVRDLQFAIEVAIAQNYSEHAKEHLAAVSGRHSRLVWDRSHG